MRFSIHFWSPISKWAIIWCQINYTFSDWLSVWPKYRLMRRTLYWQWRHHSSLQPLLMTLHGLCYREFVNTMYNVLVQQFRDGELRLSEALAEFITHHILRSNSCS